MDLPQGGCEKFSVDRDGKAEGKGRMGHTRDRGRWGDGAGTVEHRAFLLAGMEQWWGRGEMVGMGPESGALRVVLSSFAQLGLAFPV